MVEIIGMFCTTEFQQKSYTIHSKYAAEFQKKSYIFVNYFYAEWYQSEKNSESVLALSREPVKAQIRLFLKI